MRLTTAKRAALGAAAVLTVALASILTWWLLTRPDDASGPPAPVSAVATAHRACLLTDEHADPATGSRVWTAMRQTAAHNPHLITQRFTLPPATSPNSYINTLAHMRCQTIVSLSPTLRSATIKAAKQPGQTSYFLLITDHPADTGHITSLTPEQATATAISKALHT